MRGGLGGFGAKNGGRSRNVLNRRFDISGGDAGFARGADEGVSPYTYARLRLRWTAEAAVPTFKG